MVGAAGAADGGFEPRIARNHVVGEHPAVAPSADAQPIRISDALRDSMVRRRQHVVYFQIAPVGEDRFAELRSASRTAAVVDVDHDIAVSGKNLTLEGERVLILTGGPAVDPYQRRIATAGDVANRRGEQRVNLGAVLAPEGDVLGRLNLQF